MPRRVSLPGADELFRTTGGTALSTPAPRAPDASEETSSAPAAPPASAGSSAGAQAAVPPPAARPPEGQPADPAGEHGAVPGPPPRVEAGAATKAAQAASDAITQPATARRKTRGPRPRPTGRERHEEKITVYVSAEELFDLEHARLALRGEYGLAVDRGRIVREAVAVVLADLEQRGEASILVRRLRGR
ncbi:hypothetical protein I2501_24345 [Streptacidiphilus sp. NEAU-YB345]|uniref:Uncharacterized protein n=1 Tax=Streptacidiphilus fuscans TaxID=2789292 RepID=A0A931B668_9ACTN|nr:hypothetical protein [Streptacidiphilus fuscans]